jgi:hypothetical protein
MNGFSEFEASAEYERMRSTISDVLQECNRIYSLDEGDIVMKVIYP